jgi:hypothetical protein
MNHLHRRRLNASPARSSVGRIAALFLPMAVAACVPTPSGDYEVDSSTGASGGAVGSNGSGGAPPGTGGANGGTGGAPAGTGGATAVGSGGQTATGSGGAGSGGRAGTGGAGTGGRSGSGGAVGTGGSGSGGRMGTGGRAGTGGAGTGGSTAPAACTSVGSSMTVNSTIVVQAGQTYDGMCRRFIAGPSLGDGSPAEGQSPVFDIQNNGTLINVVLGFPAADGIHTIGNATLRNITWEDIGEDAMTIERSGTVTLDGGSARAGDDKIFQINAASTFRVSNFTATNAGKFIRQNGGTTFTINIFIDRCDISNMSESIARTDSSTSTVSMTNTRYSQIDDALFIGFASSNITQSNNTQY